MAGWSRQQKGALRGAVALGAALALSGCASMSDEECLTADWRLLGYEDALQGRSTATIAQYRRACAAVSVTPNLDLYQQGHQEGARQYCTAANGYRAGSNGSTYQGICPADLETGFMRGFQDGRELYSLASEISTLQASITKQESDIAAFEREIADLEEAIIDDGSSADQRRANMAEIENLNERIVELEVEISGTRRRIEEIEAEHETVAREHRLLGY